MNRNYYNDNTQEYIRTAIEVVIRNLCHEEHEPGTLHVFAEEPLTGAM